MTSNSLLDILGDMDTEIDNVSVHEPQKARKTQLMSVDESRAQLAAQAEQTNSGRKRPMKHESSTTTAVSKRARTAATNTTATMNPNQIKDLNPDDRAMLFIQRNEKHQYGKQHQILLHCVQLAKQLNVALVTSTRADAAVDLSRLGTY